MSEETFPDRIDVPIEELLPHDPQGILRHNFNSLMGIIRGNLGYATDPKFYRTQIISWTSPLENLRDELDKPKFKKDPDITKEKLDQLLLALNERLNPEIQLPTKQDVDDLIILFNKLFGKRSMT